MNKSTHLKILLHRLSTIVLSALTFFLSSAYGQGARVDCKQPQLTTSESLICDYALLANRYEDLLAEQQSLARRSLVNSSQVDAWTAQREACDSVPCMDKFFDQWEAALKNIPPASSAPLDRKNSSQERHLRDQASPKGRQTSTRETRPSPNREVGSELPQPTKLEQAVASPVETSSSLSASSQVDGSLKSWQIFVLVWILVTVIGIISGWTESIVVFRNYNDLALVFFVGCLIWIGLLVLLIFSGEGARAFSSILVVFAGVVAAGLLLTIIVRTWQDNPSLIGFPIALITKVTLSGLFLINLIDLMSPSGKTQTQRARARSDALVRMVFLAPIVYKLVRHKVGIWAPRDVFNRYQRGKLGL